MQTTQKLTPAMRELLGHLWNERLTIAFSPQFRGTMLELEAAGLVRDTSVGWYLTESGLKATQEPNHGS